MTEDPKLVQMGKILDIISNTNAIAGALEKLMNDNPMDGYTIPAEHLVIIIAQMQLCGTLASNLFEENQTIMDRLEKIMEKISTPKKD